MEIPKETSVTTESGTRIQCHLLSVPQAELGGQSVAGSAVQMALTVQASTLPLNSPKLFTRLVVSVLGKNTMFAATGSTTARRTAKGRILTRKDAEPPRLDPSNRRRQHRNNERRSQEESDEPQRPQFLRQEIPYDLIDDLGRPHEGHHDEWNAHGRKQLVPPARPVPKGIESFRKTLPDAGRALRNACP